MFFHVLENFLHECSITIENMFVHLSESILLSSIQKIGGLILTDKFAIESIFEDLRMGLPVLQLTNDKNKNRRKYETSEITKDNERIVRLSTENRILNFKLNKTKNMLEVYERYDNNPIFETDISSESDKDLTKLVNSYTEITMKELLESYFKEYYRYDIYLNIIKLLVQVTGAIRNLDYDSRNKTKNDENLNLQDLLLLNSDDNFSSTIYTVKTFLNKNFGDFEKLKKHKPK